MECAPYVKVWRDLQREPCLRRQTRRDGGATGWAFLSCLLLANECDYLGNRRRGLLIKDGVPLDESDIADAAGQQDTVCRGAIEVLFGWGWLRRDPDGIFIPKYERRQESREAKRKREQREREAGQVTGLVRDTGRDMSRDKSRSTPRDMSRDISGPVRARQSPGPGPVPPSSTPEQDPHPPTPAPAGQGGAAGGEQDRDEQDRLRHPEAPATGHPRVRVPVRTREERPAPAPVVPDLEDGFEPVTPKPRPRDGFMYHVRLEPDGNGEVRILGLTDDDRDDLRSRMSGAGLDPDRLDARLAALCNHCAAVPAWYRERNRGAWLATIRNWVEDPKGGRAPAPAGPGPRRSKSIAEIVHDVREREGRPWNPDEYPDTDLPTEEP